MSLLSRAALFLALGGIEVIKIHVLASLFYLIPGIYAIPLHHAAAVLFAAMLFSAVLRHFGGRIVFHVFCHAAGFVFAAAVLLASCPGLPFGSLEALARLGLSAVDLLKTPAEWFSFVLSLSLSTALWLRGLFLGRRMPNHADTATRFDLGVGFFLLILFISVGMRQRNPFAEALILPYFLVSIFALALSRSGTNVRGGLPARSDLLMLLPFTALFLLAGFFTVLYFPELFGLAAETNRVLGEAADVVSPWVLALLRFFFGFWAPVSAKSGQTSSGPKESEAPIPHEPGWFERLLEQILAWGLLGIFALAGVVLAGFLLWQLGKYLLSRKGREAEPLSFKAFLDYLRAYLRRLCGFFKGLLPRKAEAKAKPGNAARAYRRLIAWGRVGGVRRLPSETAREYGNRLGRTFPEARDAAGLIVTVLERDLYGGNPPAGADLRDLKKARRFFGGLKCLGARLKNRFGFLQRS